MVQGVTPAHKGLAPSRLINYFSVVEKDAHAGHTQWLYTIPFGVLRIAKPLEKIENKSETKKNYLRLKITKPAIIESVPIALSLVFDLIVFLRLSFSLAKGICFSISASNLSIFKTLFSNSS